MGRVCCVHRLTTHLATDFEVGRRLVGKNSLCAPSSSLYHLLPVVDCPDIQVFTSGLARLAKAFSLLADERCKVERKRRACVPEVFASNLGRDADVSKTAVRQEALCWLNILCVPKACMYIMRSAADQA